MPGAHIARITFLTLGLFALAGCGSYGGGGGGGGLAAPATLSATLGWTEATGPVVSYRVAVVRNDGLPEIQTDVTDNRVTVEGEVGDRVVVIVAALDANGDTGPGSPPSPEILFTDSGPVLASSATVEEDETGDAVARDEESPEGDETGNDASGSDAANAGEAVTDSSGNDADANSSNDPGVDTTLLADSADALLWEADAPSRAMRLTSLWDDALHDELAFERPGADWWVAARDDVDGDGRLDLIWENEFGQLAFSSLGTLVRTAPVAPLTMLGALGDDEKLVATGDFDGDGRADLLVEDDATGDRVVWWLSASGTESVTDLTGAGAGSSLATSGDFDGDGREDLVWRAADGALSVHFMDGASSDASLDLGAAAGDAIASGDVDGDGDDDLLVRDAAGVSVLEMAGRGDAVRRLLSEGNDWEVAGLGDFDGNGTADLLWVSPAGWLVGLETSGAEADYVAIDPGADWGFVE